MSNFGRLQAALAAATNEVTVAAANINFDFTLVKYEAPKEFRPLEGYLTTTRKADAETGRTHIIARRLGALFDGVCPDTPNLLKAYGTRVSEISKAASQQDSRDYSKSIFSAYIGVDATSIWAAATSSKTAVQVHLLACMLAELWEAPEAVAIWAELVTERRKDIARRLEEGEAVHFGLASAAAQQDITREQLAAWDASARAWIQTGKTVMKRQDRQLRLVLKNVYFAINPSDAPFVSVIDAWKLALDTTEKLVAGMPQEAHNGAAILGLAAWHIFPDIHVYDNRNINVSMSDSLVAKGGVLALSSSPMGSPSDNHGVYWSLCLSHLTFYGPPVTAHHTLEESPRRISFQNLLHATIGSILSRWKVKVTENVNGIKVLVQLWKMISAAKSAMFPPLNMMITAAEECLVDRHGAQSYLQLGRRRSGFIKDPERTMSTQLFPGEATQNPIKPFFGLTSLHTLLRCIPASDDRVMFLRRILEKHATLEPSMEDQEIVIFDMPTYTAHNFGLGRSQHSSEATLASTRKRRRSNKGGEFCLHGSQLVKTDGSKRTVYDFWAGCIDSTAIFNRSVENVVPIWPPDLDLEDLHWCTDNQFVSHTALATIIGHLDATLLAIASLHCVSPIFKNLPRLLIQTQVLDTPLLDRSWPRSLGYYFRFTDNILLEEDRRYKFPNFNGHDFVIEAIAHMAFGYEIPSGLVSGDIMGISCEDSIFVPSKLVQDPTDARQKFSVTQILGNVGQPGLVVLSSPANPMIAPLGESAWKIHNMNPFDGKGEDALSSTSLHLSFTKWSQALNSARLSGIQHVQGLLMEAVVSIKEAGRWIGDVDVLKALESNMVIPVSRKRDCCHKARDNLVVPLASVECWDEIQDCPDEPVVIRAYGNWVARLAATSYLAQQIDRGQLQPRLIFICPSDVCWACLDPPGLRDIYVY